MKPEPVVPALLAGYDPAAPVPFSAQDWTRPQAAPKPTKKGRR